MHGGNGNDHLTGIGNFSTINEQYFGDAGNDTIISLGGNDLLDGGTGHDELTGGAGADRLVGGTGFDYAGYLNATAEVTADLKNPANNMGDAAGDSYLSIEGLFGSRFSDLLTGDDAVNDIIGLDGNDRLNGWAGNDILHGGNGDDTLDGGPGMDVLIGGAGNDTFLFNRGEAAGDAIIDFNVNGAGPGDHLLFQDYGTAAQGATFVKVDATHWSINSSDGAIHEVITLYYAAVHPTDYTFI
jgi:Ca2+-binding RTX toxin-like protein